MSRPEKNRPVGTYKDRHSRSHLLLQPKLSLPRLLDLVLQARFFSLSLPHLRRPGTIKIVTASRQNISQEHGTRWLVGKRERERERARDR